MTCSERVREVLEDDDGLRAGVLELMLELARGVERIRVDDGQAGAQGAVQRDRVLQDVRQHERDAIALLQVVRLLQPGGEVARPLLVLAHT